LLEEVGYSMKKCARGGKMFLRSKIIYGIVSLLFLFGLFSAFVSANATYTSRDVRPVVESQWVEDNLRNPAVRIVFVDDWPSTKPEFEKKHIPGSGFIGIGPFMGTLGNGSAPPDKKKFEALMGGLGIKKSDHVIVYGLNGKNPFTLSAFWLMEYFGHEKISYLNGGLEKWNRERRKSANTSAGITPTTYNAGSANKSMWVDAKYVLGSLHKSNVAIVDARGSDEYKGIKNTDNNKRTGRIPGAGDLGYYKTNFNQDGTLKSIKDLNAAYMAKGVTGNKEVISYCQGGVKAANDYFVLKHILGFKNVKVYVGSWGEWGNRVDPAKYPVEK
jgi:thiosulfate/3-mercaptopyruvate sulfurtransferase